MHKSIGSSSSRPRPEFSRPCRLLRTTLGLALVVLGAGQEARAQEEKASGKALTLENDILSVALSPSDGALTVVDKRIALVWRQQASPGFRVDPEASSATPAMLSARVVGSGGTLGVTITFTRDCPHAFDLVLDVPDRRYNEFPGYPFPFAAPANGWYYVQNTTGEGILMSLDKREEIQKPFNWGGSQPWWGITDLNRAMRARLDTFKLPDGRPGQEDHTVYATPLRINYAFFTEGGYVGLAKEYRHDFLRSHPEVQPLRERTAARPAVGHLKDGVYVYLWGENPAEDLALVQEMKAAGIDRGIAVTYGRHEVDRASCDGIKQLGWVVGKYQMPTGNLFQVASRRQWPSALLTGQLMPEPFFGRSNRNAWNRICGKQVLQEWPEKAQRLINDYGVQLFYFDTLVVQLAPCLHPDHPSTIEENLAARQEIIRRTRALGMIVGSGEGLCPSWALPELDFYEGVMSLRTYGDTPLGIPGGDFAKELGDDYQKQAAVQLDETRRIPLHQLAFHDYAAGTWVWRDTNYQSTPFAWKKNLFNILYGTMPMWHINRPLWERHKTEMIASYRDIASVRQRIGFAEMLNHGWLTADRSVQFTDWETGDRVIVNFGDRPFERQPGKAVPQRSFLVERMSGR